MSSGRRRQASKACSKDDAHETAMQGKEAEIVSFSRTKMRKRKNEQKSKGIKEDSKEKAGGVKVQRWPISCQ